MRIILKRFHLLVLPVLFAVRCHGQLNGPLTKTGDVADKLKFTWSTDDLLSQEDADYWRIAPDCRWAVWVKSTPDRQKNERVGNLFLSSLTDARQIQLTQGHDGAFNPKWAPDGHLIAFFSSRPNPKAKAQSRIRNQIWLLNPFSGEPWPLTSEDRVIYAFDWAGSNRIIYRAQEGPSDYDKTNKETGDFSRVVEDDAHEPPIRLFGVDVNSAQVTRLTDNTDRITAFSVSPDGTHAVTFHDRSLRALYDASVLPTIILTDLKTGERKQIVTDAKYNLGVNLSWERNSRGFYASSFGASIPKSYPAAIIELCHYTLAADSIEKVDLDWDRGLASGIVEVTDGGFIALLADGVHSKLARYFLAGGQRRREWITGVHAINLYDYKIGKDDHTLVYGYSSATSPPQYCRATLNEARIESPVQLTSLNPQFQSKPMAKCEVVHWKGALGETVEGLLYYPLNYKPNKKYPLIVQIHGGPSAAFHERWYGPDEPMNNNNLLNALGAFVFRPNYHGSSDYGQKWVQSIVARPCELEVEDINTGVDCLIARGLVDPARLAVMGWSYGGTLTAALTVSTSRYKAAISGDGPIELIDDWAKSLIGARYCLRLLPGKSPLDDPATLMRNSPFYQLNKVTTPTLILFGAEDNVASVDQGWMYYRALQQSGKTDVRFVLFPGEGHVPSKLVYMKRMLVEELGWFEKYLLGELKLRVD